tara:strand:- start:785 stop:991 length:207 start_codon:yes stop_codon:yes gene_type:complete
MNNENEIPMIFLPMNWGKTAQLRSMKPGDSFKVRIENLMTLRSLANRVKIKIQTRKIEGTREYEITKL